MRQDVPHGHAGDTHGSHTHWAHGHGAHDPAHHAPSPSARVEYERAFAGAQPAPGGKVVAVALDAREVEWVFVPGKQTRAWGYNGQVPGPVIEANVGDVLEVRLTNSLPEPTTIHWHGLRLPAPMDGTENVQHPILPGDTFTYRFVLPDAGTFWYHPHSNETVQLERGLYGALIVRGPNEPELDAERVLVLDDVVLDRKGQIKPPGGFVERHDGRLGRTLLINGREQPELSMAAGQVERWRVVNAASARYVRLSIGGRPFRLLGTDGGLVTAPVAMTEVLLAPADRVDIAVGPFAEGEALAIEALPYTQGSVARPRLLRYGTVRIGAAVASRASIPERLREIVPLVTGPVTPTREVHLGFKMTLRRGVEFTINRELHHRADPVRVGEL